MNTFRRITGMAMLVTIILVVIFSFLSFGSMDNYSIAGFLNIVLLVSLFLIFTGLNAAHYNSDKINPMMMILGIGIIALSLLFRFFPSWLLRFWNIYLTGMFLFIGWAAILFALPGTRTSLRFILRAGVLFYAVILSTKLDSETFFQWGFYPMLLFFLTIIVSAFRKT